MRPLAGARILIAVTVPRSAGFYAGQLAALRTAGADVAFLCSPSPAVADQCAAEGAHYLPVPLDRAPSLRDPAALLAVTRAIASFRPDVVNAGTPKAGLLGMLAARALGVRHRVHTLHGLRYEAAAGVARRILFAAQRLSCGLATHVVCVGPSLRARAIATNLLTAATVIGDGTVNGIDVEHFHPVPTTRSAPVVGYLGRLARDKGLADLTAAWPAVAAPLLIGGTPDETDPPPPLPPSATLLGHVDPFTFLSSIDILVLPTYREGFPTVPLEAAAMRIPVVATDATGCADAIVDGVTGTLVPTHSPPALAAAINRYLASPSLRATPAPPPTPASTPSSPAPASTP